MVRPSAHSFAFLLILLLFISGCTGISRPDFIILDQNVTTASCDNNTDCNITGNIFNATGHHTSAYSAGTNILLDTADNNKFSFNDKNFLDTDNNFTAPQNFGDTTTWFDGIANNGCSLTWEDGNALLRCPIISVFEIRSETVKDINTLGSIIPASDGTFNLGNPSKKWLSLWVDDINNTNTINTTDIYLDRIRSRVNDVFINPGPDGGAFTNFFILNRDSGVLQSFMGVSSDESFTEFVEMGLDVPAAIAEIDTNLRWLMLTADDSVGTSQKFLVDNVVAPQTDAAHDLGGLAIEMDAVSAQRRWRDLYLSGTANVRDVNATGDITAVNITATNDLNSPRINTADLNAQDATIDTKGILKVNPAHLAIIEGDLDFDANVMRLLDFFNGVIIETIDINVFSDGSTVDLNMSRVGRGDLNLHFSTGFFSFDATPPATVQLTAGSDTGGTLNYVFIPISTKSLTSNTTGFPLIEEHAEVATVLVQSAGSVEIDGAYKVHVWTDHTADINSTSDGEGHLDHLNNWIRKQPATWELGVVPTVSIATRSGINDQVDFSSTSGFVLQLHQHSFPDFNTGADSNIFVVNDSSAAFTKVQDLNALLTDSDGDSMSNKYFSLVIWGVVSEKDSDSKLMLNLPSGSYNKQQDALDDVSGFDNFNIPTDFTGTGFLITRATLKHSVASGGTWTLIQLEDLRGQFPSKFAGGTASITTQFPDNTFLIFDETDVTKILDFQVETITTGNTRTITMSDRDLNLDDLLLTDLNALRDVNADRGIASPAFFGANGNDGSLRGAWAVGDDLTISGDVSVQTTSGGVFKTLNNPVTPTNFNNWQVLSMTAKTLPSDVFRQVAFIAVSIADVTDGQIDSRMLFNIKQNNVSVEAFRITETAVVINEASVDGRVFRVESDDDTEAFKVTGSTGNTKVGGDLVVDGSLTVNPDGTSTGDFIAEGNTKPLLLWVDASKDCVKVGEGVCDNLLHVQHNLDNSASPFTNANASIFIENTNAAGFGILKLSGTSGMSKIVYGGQSIALDHLAIMNRGEAVDVWDWNRFGDITWGSGEPGHDYNLFVDGQSNDGLLQFMEDEDEWRFNEAINVIGKIDASSNISVTSVTPRFFLKESDTTDRDYRLQTSGGGFFLSQVNDNETVIQHRFRVDAIASGGDIYLLDNEGKTAVLIDGATSARTYDTNVVKAVFHVSGLADSVATDVFRITTTNEAGSNDGGSYSIVVVATATQNNEAAEANDGSVRGYSATFSHINVGSGVDSETDVVDIYETDPSANVGGPPDDIISDVNMTVNEISNYIHDLQFTIAQGGNSPTANSGAVVMEVELIWRGYLTPPTMTQIVT